MKGITVLIVEDDAVDAEMFRRSLRQQDGSLDIRRAVDGAEAIELLRDLRPDLILMDIRMPRMDGRETLVHIKGHADLRSIPVLMVSTSVLQDDVDFCYQNHCNAYLAKPRDPEDVGLLTEAVTDFWMRHAVRSGN